MNYIGQINAFYAWLETNNLSHTGRHLWHALMHIANRTGWKDTFNLAIGTIQVKTGMSESMIKRARNELKEKGLISWRSRGGNQSAEYSMVPIAVHLYPQFEPQYAPQCAPQPVPQYAPQCAPQPVPIPIQENTKQEDTKHVGGEGRAQVALDDADLPFDLSPADIQLHAETLEATGAACIRVGMPFCSQMDFDLAIELAARYTLPWLIQAIIRAKERGKPNWGFIKGILKRWKDAGAPDSGESPPVDAMHKASLPQEYN